MDKVKPCDEDCFNCKFADCIKQTNNMRSLKTGLRGKGQQKMEPDKGGCKK